MNKKLKQDEVRNLTMGHILVFVVGLSLLLINLSACNQPESKAGITVSAAANLIPAFEEIAQRFYEETNILVTYNFSSSGQLTQQIEQGAPVDLFASANTAFIDRLIEGGFVIPASKRFYASGRLAIWSLEPALVPDHLSGLTTSQIDRIAIANPQHAPYGIIAKQALEHSRLWEALQAKLVLANDVRQTLTYAETGDVTVALVPLSLVYRLNNGAYYLVPTEVHPPIKQALGIVRETTNFNAAQQFSDFILSDQGQSILQSYGYSAAQ